jgi:uncharacterized protein (TIGR04255 family)
MLEPRHLKNAPIVEAVIDLAISPPPGFELQKLLELKKTLGDSYPNATEIYQSTIQFAVGQPVPMPDAKGVHIGYRFISKDGLYIAQLRADEFVFSRLKPYPSWEEFSAEARKVWNHYTAIISSISSIKRIALRFINQLKLPLPASFEDYLTVPPRIPEGLPKSASGFFSQLIIEDTQNKITSALVQFLQPLTDPSSFIVIIDISSFRQGDFELDESKIWAIFEKLRETKNRVFFSSITERTVKLYE